MGMPEQKPQNGMNIAPDGTIYEILDDGTIKRIGKVSSNGEFEPFGGPKDGISVKNGIIYRVINGKKQKIGRVLPNGDIESINQKIKSETEISRNNVKIVTIISACCVLLAVVFVAGFIKYAEIKNQSNSALKNNENNKTDKEVNESSSQKTQREKNALAEKQAEADKITKLYKEYQDEKSLTSKMLEDYIRRFNILKLNLTYDENKQKIDEIIGKIETRYQTVKKEEDQLASIKAKQEANAQTAEATQKEYIKKIKPWYEKYKKEPDKIKNVQNCLNNLNLLKVELKHDANKKKLEEIIGIIDAKKKELEDKEEQHKLAEKEKQRKIVEYNTRKANLKGRKIGGLNWSDRSSNEMNWYAAKQYCKDLTEGGFTDWRLPNIDELRTIIKDCPKTETGGECKVSEKNGCLSYSQCGNGYRDGSCYCNNGGYYSKLGDDIYLWSSSTLSDGTDSAWLVYFGNGNVGFSGKSGSSYVRCVR